MVNFAKARAGMNEAQIQWTEQQLTQMRLSSAFGRAIEQAIKDGAVPACYP